jgi:signal transduction histidine kinase/ActR/RegA family two-component response regulator
MIDPSSPARSGRLGGVRSWLARIKARDPLEQRQAYLLQLSLLFVGAAFLVGGVSNALRASPGSNGVTANLIAALVTGVLLVVLRRGFFRAVAWLTVGALIAALGQALANSGPVQGGTYLALLMVPIVLAGLVLPRWGLLVTLIAVIGTGMLAARAQPITTVPSLADVLGNFLYASLLTAGVVDGFGGTLRSALARAIAHEQDLEATRVKLQDAVRSLQAEIEERERLEAQLAEAQRLESIGRLAGGVAHDFNNMLMAIGGYAETLSADLDPTDPGQEGFAGIRQAVDQAASLTRQLLAFSRNQELRPTVIDLRELVATVEPLLRRLLGERIRIDIRPSAELWPALADRTKLESVLVNLAVNARDAMPGGGTITIETANVELDGTYASSHAEVVPGPYAMIAVSDTGTGIDDETASHIFEPFFTTKEVGKGTGLGLATVYGTVRQSGGHIWVYSEPGRGTTFKIYLPRSEATGVTETPPPAAQPRALPAPPSDRKGTTILLVEDEQVVRDMVVAALQRRGYSVLPVASAEAAIELLGRPDAAVDLMLSDIVMPGLSGPELVAQVWQARPDLPTIFMSGYTGMTIERGQIPDGVTVLEKPFTSERLDEAIREALSRVDPRT